MDLQISKWLQGVESVIFYSAMKTISVPGDPLIAFTIIIITSAIFLLTKRKKAALFILAIIPLSLIPSLIKSIVSRPRPDCMLLDRCTDLKDFSFPSSHVFFYTIFFGFIYYVLSKETKSNTVTMSIRIICLLLIFAISISRIYLGAHWATDTLASYILGAIVLWILINVYHKAVL